MESKTRHKFTDLSRWNFIKASVVLGAATFISGKNRIFAGG
jgi:hypothetical protein